MRKVVIVLALAVAMAPTAAFADVFELTRPPFLGGFLVFALVWAAIPVVASGIIASNRGQNVLLAVALGLFLGWLGLAIVYFAMKPEVISAGSAAVDRIVRPRETDAATRMATLERLRESGSITDEEFEAKRREIIDAI